MHLTSLMILILSYDKAMNTNIRSNFQYWSYNITDTHRNANTRSSVHYWNYIPQLIYIRFLGNGPYVQYFDKYMTLIFMYKLL